MQTLFVWLTRMSLFFKGRGGIALSLFLLLTITLSGMRIMKPSSGGIITQSRSDFDDYYTASVLLSQGKDPYRIDSISSFDASKLSADDLFNPAVILKLMDAFKGAGSYLYPPFTAFTLLPLTGLPYETAALIYHLLSMLSLFLFVLFINKKYNILKEKEAFFMAVFFSGLFMYRYLAENADNGNIGFFLILLATIGLYYSFEEKHLFSIGGGVLLGLATVLKITPGFLGLVLLAGGRFYAIAGMGLGVMIGLFLPALFTGWDQNLKLHTDWYNLIIKNYSDYTIIRPWANNQTISAFFGKLLVPGADLRQSAYGLPFIFKNRMPTKEEASLVVMIVRSLNLIVIAMALSSSLIVFYKNFKNKITLKFGSPVFISILTIAILASLISSGVSWYHAYSFLIIPFLLRYLHYLSGNPLTKIEKYGFFIILTFGLIQYIFPKAMKEALSMFSVFLLLCLGFYFAYIYQTVSQSLREKDGI